MLGRAIYGSNKYSEEGKCTWSFRSFGFTGIKCESLEWIYLAQDMDHCKDAVNTTIKSDVQQNARIILTS